MAVAPPDGAMGQWALTVFVAGVQDDDLVFILDIVVDHPLPSARRTRAAAHWNCGYNGRRGRVYHSGVIAFTFIVKICLEAGS